jgi:hypothetical protein
MIAPSRRARKGFERGKIRKLRRRLRKRSNAAEIKTPQLRQFRQPGSRLR